MPGQVFEQQFRPFVVRVGGTPTLNPFSGGIDAPIHQFVDIDGDGDPDLFLLDRDARLNFYRNVGTPAQPVFQLAAIGYQQVAASAWFHFADIDNDGDFDLFCNGPGASVSLYRNAGTPQVPAFVLETESIRDVFGTPLISETISIPAFEDLDGDGDLDFFSGNSVGSIWYYENTGTPAEYQFTFVTDRYQDIVIIGGTTSWGDRGGDGTTEPFAKTGRRLHGAMAINFADLDGDGDKDLFWGDFFNPGLYYIRNDGDATNPQLVLADSSFPDTDPVQSTGFNMPTFVDLDGDGDLDMVIGVLTGGGGSGRLRLYRNFGTPDAPFLAREPDELLTSIDVGSASSPTFADVDGDGDLDLLIGSEDGAIAFFERVGTPSDPEFNLSDPDYIALPSLLNASPAFGDLNGDGFPDLVVGDANGRLRYFQGSLSGFTLTPFPLDGANFGQNASPVLVDIDHDGDLDLFVGTGGGRIVRYTNGGTAAAPLFVQESSFYLGIDVGEDAKPVFADIDGDGLTDLIIGARDGSLKLWRNTGNSTFPDFAFVPGFFSNVSAGTRCAPAVADVNADGFPDLFLGNLKGGLYFYKGASSPPVALPTAFSLSQNFPNPFNAGTVLEVSVPVRGWVTVKVFNVLGQELVTLADDEREAGTYPLRFEGDGFASGVYFCRFQSGEHAFIRKMVLIR